MALIPFLPAARCPGSLVAAALGLLTWSLHPCGVGLAELLLSWQLQLGRCRLSLLR